MDEGRHSSDATELEAFKKDVLEWFDVVGKHLEHEVSSLRQEHHDRLISLHQYIKQTISERISAEVADSNLEDKI